MQKKSLLKVDRDELCSTIEDNSDEHKYYLDLETGEILFISDYMEDNERENLRKRIDDDPSRYEGLPKAESREGYEDMKAFISTLEDDCLAKLLEVAINGKGAFRLFKDILLNYPEERERWFQFKDDRTDERAREWLDSIDVTLLEE